MTEKLRRTDEQLASFRMPEAQPCDAFSLTRKDALIVCAGFEDRAIYLLTREIQQGAAGFSVIGIRYQPELIENKSSELIQLCQVNNIDLQWVIYSRDNRSGVGDEIVSRLFSVKGKIVIDISAMSRLLVVQTIVALSANIDLFSRTIVAYAEAQEYPPNKDEVEDVILRNEGDLFAEAMLLSSGVFDVAVLPELSSVSMEGQPIRLIAFPSFNPDQLAALRAEIQPSSFSMIHSNSPREDHSWRKLALAKLNKTSSLNTKEDFEVSTVDYRETLNCLLTIYSEHSEGERIVVAPTGTKMQSVGVALFRSFLSDIQIVYPTPRAFINPRQLTVGVLSVCAISFASLADLLRSVTTKPIAWS